MMLLIPINLDPAKNAVFNNNPDCKAILDVYPDFYNKIGYCLPWIGYFAIVNDIVVGYGGFKSQPKEGKVEIAYGTVERFEGQGIGTELCRQLVLLALQADASLTITARTLPENNASGKILMRNRFEYQGMVYDDDDGDVCEWKFTRHEPL